jgi:predicted amidohydrolase YtcJ
VDGAGLELFQEAERRGQLSMRVNLLLLHDHFEHALVADVHRSGSRLGIRANGDRAIALLLDAYEAAEREWPRGDAHHRIEHCTVITPEIVARMRRLGLVAVPFGGYVVYQPLLAMRSCVTRQAEDGRVLGGSQRITAREALALYTIGSAAAFGEAGVKGRLAPGYLADFVVLGGDPLEADPSMLDAVAVLETWVGAERVWPRPARS